MRNGSAASCPPRLVAGRSSCTHLPSKNTSGMAASPTRKTRTRRRAMCRNDRPPEQPAQLTAGKSTTAGGQSGFIVVEYGPPLCEVLSSPAVGLLARQSPRCGGAPVGRRPRLANGARRAEAVPARRLQRVCLGMDPKPSEGIARQDAEQRLRLLLDSLVEHAVFLIDL